MAKSKPNNLEVEKKHNWYAKTLNEVESELNTNLKDGLTSLQAQKLLKEKGHNKISDKKATLWIIFFLKCIIEPLSIILLIAGIISISLPFILSHSPEIAEYIEFCVIMATVITNALIGSIQEMKAQASTEALKKMSNLQVHVIRDEQEIIIDSVDLVVGDVVVLKLGQVIPADVRLFKTSYLEINESTLTGETHPVSKNSHKISKDSLVLAKQENMAFMSTIVTSGNAIGIVVENAKTSEIGKIIESIDEIKDQKTPLQIRLNKITKIITYISIFAALLLLTILMLERYVFEKEYLTISQIIVLSISSAIAIIPVSLTIIVSVILSISTKRMADKHVIVKTLSAIETLGEIDVICSDKTGTLTQNKMTVVSYTIDNKIYDADELTFSTESHFVKAMALNNDSQINSEGQQIGSPTELALTNFLLTLKIKTKTMAKKYHRLDVIPFSSETKLMTTVNQVEDKQFIYIKGALDYLLEHSKFISINDEIKPLTQNHKETILKNAEKMSNEALRIIAFAYKEKQENEIKETYNDNLIFIGTVGIIDPPRPEAIDAIKQAKKAGIRMIMITGDHALTAMAIAKKMQITNDQTSIITGSQLDEMNDEQLSKQIDHINVFARVNPEHKTRIVNILQSKDLIVAMTGDGVNDAPSLRKADVGIAMGMAGTDAAKQAADVILTDDNFASIIKGVEEGRNAYQKLKAVTAFALGSNPQIFVMFIFILIYSFTPLKAVNILWFGLIVDSILTIPLALSDVSEDLMEIKPVKSTDSIFNGIRWQMGLSLLLGSTCALIASIIGYEISSKNPDLDAEQISATMAFIIIIFSPIFIMPCMKPTKNKTLSSKKVKFKINWAMIISIVLAIILNLIILFVPWVNENIFNVVDSMPLKMWLISFLFSLLPMISIVLFKLFIDIKNKKNKINLSN